LPTTTNGDRGERGEGREKRGGRRGERGERRGEREFTFRKKTKMSIKDYRELIVWQKAMDLVEKIYHITRTFPREEIYGLTSQIRRAAVSIPSNIAEGNGRNTTRDYIYFLGVAYGSVKEVETQVLIAERLQYVNSTSSTELVNMTGEIARLISGLTNSLNRKIS
jgi:four helix bundle protein